MNNRITDKEEVDAFAEIIASYQAFTLEVQDVLDGHFNGIYSQQEVIGRVADAKAHLDTYLENLENLEKI